MAPIRYLSKIADLYFNPIQMSTLKIWKNKNFKEMPSINSKRSDPLNNQKT